MSPLRARDLPPGLAKQLGVTVPKRHKFNAIRTMTVDGRKFDSRAEADHYIELTRRQRIGEIRNLRCQPSLVLLAPELVGLVGVTDNVNGAGIIGTRPLGEYRADFDYEERRGSRWVRVMVDVKGFEVPLQRWKRIHAERQYGIEIVVIRKGRR